MARSGKAAGGKAAPVSFIVDTDCFYDDLLALGCVAAGGSLALVTTVAGMLPRSSGARTVRGLLRHLQGPAAAAKVVSGAAEPRAPCALTGQPEPEWLREVVEGELALAAERLPGCGGEALLAVEEEADRSLEAVVEALEGSSDGGVDLVALGPLTNVARWLDDAAAAELLAKKLRRVWVMGGVLDTAKGNVGPAEFNFAVDPAAAGRVLSSCLAEKLRLVGLDVCNEEHSDHAEHKRRVAAASPTGFLSALQGVNDCSMVYDPVAAYAALHDGSGFDFTAARVAVDLETGELLRDGVDAPDAAPVLIATGFRAREEYVAWLVDVCASEAKAAPGGAECCFCGTM